MTPEVTEVTGIGLEMVSLIQTKYSILLYNIWILVGLGISGQFHNDITRATALSKAFLRSTKATNMGNLFNFLAPIRPVARLVQREVQSHLEACHAEAVQQLRKCVKCGKIIWPLFSVIDMSSHGKFMLCTALVLPSATAHNTKLVFLSIPP